jgi:hypothetical protein
LIFGIKALVSPVSTHHRHDCFERLRQCDAAHREAPSDDSWPDQVCAFGRRRFPCREIDLFQRSKAIIPARCFHPGLEVSKETRRSTHGVAQVSCYVVGMPAAGLIERTNRAHGASGGMPAGQKGSLPNTSIKPTGRDHGPFGQGSRRPSRRPS